MLRKIPTIFVIISLCMLLTTCGGGSDSNITGGTGSQDILFQQTFGGSGTEFGMTVLQTSDGGFILLGETDSQGNGGTDIYLVKTDSSGQKQWEKTYGGANDDYSDSIAIAPDKGFIIVGDTNSFGAGGRDIYLIKTDSSGNVAWTKTFGGTGNDKGGSVQPTVDGYIVVGTIDDNTNADMITLIKTDTAGNTVWDKTYGDTDWAGDKGIAVLTTPSGGYVVLGDGKGTQPFFGSTYLTDYWLFETDVNGVVIWSNKYGSSDFEHADSLAKTNSGGYILLGESNRRANFYSVNTDSNGTLIWSKEYEYSNYDTNEGNAVIQAADGGFAMLGDTMKFDVGQTSGDFFMYLLKTDSQGNKNWEKIYQGNGEAIGNSIIQTSDENYVLFGTTISNSDHNMYLLKVAAP